MLQKKYAQPLFVILMSFSMSVIMCGVVVAVNTGMNEGFIGRWFYSWIFAFPVSYTHLRAHETNSNLV